MWRYEKRRSSCFLPPVLSLDVCAEVQHTLPKLTTSFISMLLVSQNSHLSTVIRTVILIYWYQHEAWERLLTSYFSTEGNGFNRTGGTFLLFYGKVKCSSLSKKTFSYLIDDCAKFLHLKQFRHCTYLD